MPNYKTQDEKVKSLKKEIQKKMRAAYWDYIESIITPMDDTEPTEPGTVRQGMKRFWSYIKSQRKDHTGVASLRENGKTTDNPEEKANILNKQFQSVFQKETTTMPLNNNSPHHTIPDIDITENGVRKMLERLKPHKAMGPDEIGPRILKELAPTIAPMLTSIYRKSYATGEVPDDWRKANVVAIYKKGRKSEAENYRPISLTCVCCKIMEHIVASGLMRHADRHHLLYDLQHGFRDKRSCETQLLGMQSDVLRSMAEGKQADAIILDFSKAFDKVGHQKLVYKLDHYGVRGRTNAWIKNFLTGRKQTVVLDGARSNEVDVTSGVPQGSVLGPCLFLIYINDLPDCLKSNVRLFADDTVVYLTIGHQSDASILQEDLQRLEAWEALWGMEFHPQKCQIITFTRKRNPILTKYTLHGHVLDQVDEAKYLGVTFQKDMRFTTHLNNISTEGTSKSNPHASRKLPTKPWCARLWNTPRLYGIPTPKREPNNWKRSKGRLPGTPSADTEIGQVLQK